MPTVSILPHPEICPEGQNFEGKKGASFCEAMLKHCVAIKHARNMVATCATLHFLIRDGAYTLYEADNENDQLGNAWELEPTLRLACSVQVKDGDITVALPKDTGNHAREHRWN